MKGWPRRSLHKIAIDVMRGATATPEQQLIKLRALPERIVHIEASLSKPAWCRTVPVHLGGATRVRRRSRVIPNHRKASPRRTNRGSRTRSICVFVM